MTTEALTFRQKLEIAKHEILAASIVVSDVLAKREARPADFERLALCLARLRALIEEKS